MGGSSILYIEPYKRDTQKLLVYPTWPSHSARFVAAAPRFRVWVPGLNPRFRVWGLYQSLRARYRRDASSGFRVEVRRLIGFGVQGLRFRIKRFMVKGYLGFRVQGLGFRIKGLCLKGFRVWIFPQKPN